jgi:hypothetical protein
MTTDLDGDPVTATITWERNGAAFNGADTLYFPGDLIPQSEMDDGDIWTCTVELSDGTVTVGPTSISTIVSGSSFTEQFTLRAPTQADILLVVDDSGSMAEEQQKLTSGMDNLIDALDLWGVDYHVGVITTDMADRTKSGRLQGSPLYVTPNTPNALAEINANATVGTGGSSDEMGRRAVDAALTAPLLTGFNNGFYRANAELAIVVLSDESDFSGNNPTRNAFISFLGTLKADPEKVSFHALVGPALGCVTADIGTEYLAVQEAVGGYAESICEPDYSVFLSAVGSYASGARQVFELSNLPAGRVEVELTEPGANPRLLRAGVDYAVVDTTLALGDAPAPGSTINATYDILCP